MNPSIPAKQFHSVADLRTTDLPYDVRPNGELAAIESGRHVPFSIARVFTARAPAGSERGMHAHRLCNQFLVCPSGRIEVFCDDGAQRTSFVLERCNVGLLVPRSLWASQNFIEDSTLLVLCDRYYEEDDYIRNYDEFRAWRAGNLSLSGGARP